LPLAFLDLGQLRFGRSPFYAGTPSNAIDLFDELVTELLEKSGAIRRVLSASMIVASSALRASAR
jgi:hypothetical protein